MPGDGQIIPNGSVHWHIRHFGKPAQWTGVQNHQSGGRQDVSQDNQRFLMGVDPADAPASLNVTLRFRQQSEAQTALQAQPRLNQQTGMWEVELTVPWTPVSNDDAEQRPRNRHAPLYFRWGQEPGAQP
jgi:hypothetical protein